MKKMRHNKIYFAIFVFVKKQIITLNYFFYNLFLRIKYFSYFCRCIIRFFLKHIFIKKIDYHYFL